MPPSPKAAQRFLRKLLQAVEHPSSNFVQALHQQGFFSGWHRSGVKTRQNQRSWFNAMKEVSLLEMIGRSLAKVAAGAGVAAVLIWLTYVMLDVGHMQSGFTLPQSSY